jgi:hypothetical protein
MSRFVSVSPLVLKDQSSIIIPNNAFLVGLDASVAHSLMTRTKPIALNATLPTLTRMELAPDLNSQRLTP